MVYSNNTGLRKIIITASIIAVAAAALYVAFFSNLAFRVSNLKSSVTQSGLESGEELICTNVDQYPIGQNLLSHEYYSTGFLFADAFKSAHPWMTHNNTTGNDDWEYPKPIPMDENGWPAYSPFEYEGQQHAPYTQIFQGAGGHFPAGEYTLIFNGTGRIEIGRDGGTNPELGWSSPWQEFSGTGGESRFTFYVDPSDIGIGVRIVESLASDHIRDIKLIMPGFALDEQGNNVAVEDIPLFHPTFIQQLQPFPVLRAMVPMDAWTYACDDLAMDVNDPGCVSTWDMRAKPTDAIQAGPRGLALEHVIDLANETEADVWVSLPHAADDNFIHQYARLLRDRLNPNQKVYIEYYNEAWNPAPVISSYDYLLAKGLELWPQDSLSLPGSPLTVAEVKALPDGPSGNYQRTNIMRPITQKFYIHRSLQIMNIFREEFGSNDRLVRVLGSQHNNQWVTDSLFNIVKNTEINYALPEGYLMTVPAVNPDYSPGQTVGDFFDVMAVHSYFGGQDSEANALKEVDEILDLAEENLPTIIAGLAADKALADEENLGLVVYEGGEHMTRLSSDGQYLEGSNENFYAANRSPRMYQIYQDLFNSWFAINPGGLFMHFGYMEMPLRYGFFGSIEYYDQPITTAHKYRSILDFLGCSNEAFPPLPPLLPSNFLEQVHQIIDSYQSLPEEATILEKHEAAEGLLEAVIQQIN